MATTNCELCGRVIPAAESSTGGFLKTYCGCDRVETSIMVDYDAELLSLINRRVRFDGRREELLREYESEQTKTRTPSPIGPQSCLQRSADA